MRRAVTIYLDETAYRKLKMLIRPRPVSREIDMLIRRRIAELEGREYDPLESADYEALKQEYRRLIREVERMTRMLKKRGTYQRLIEVTADIEEMLGTKDLKRVAPALLDRWKDGPEDVHLFISFLEELKSMKETERRLEKIRRSRNNKEKRGSLIEPKKRLKEQARTLKIP